MSIDKPSNTGLLASILAIGILFVMVGYGLVIRPMLGQSAMPLELIFLSAASVVIVQLLLMGKPWQQIQDAVTAKMTQALPTLLLLFAIGLLIGSWVVSGTIAMLVYYALDWIEVEYFYLIAFVAPIGFSLCTGTSWGSIATIGLVLISVAQVVGGDLAICTGAIVGGAYFGDKLSPLSDTTNIAAVAADVPLYEHIKAMMQTTLPAAVFAAIGFLVIGWLQPIDSSLVWAGDNSLLQQTQQAINDRFQFHWMLLLPIVVILTGAYKRWPALPVLLVSAMLAMILAMFYQSFDSDVIVQTAYRGFNLEMASCVDCAPMPQQIDGLLNRGGLYALIDPIVITLMVFIYVGAIDCMGAVQILLQRVLRKVKHNSTLIATTLGASAFTNAMTSSQYANSFIVSEAFADKYDEQGVPRKVLSRSLEDTGTMIESLVPWSTTAVFVYATLGVAVHQYWQWQLLSLFNISLAFLLAFNYRGSTLPTIQRSSING